MISFLLIRLLIQNVHISLQISIPEVRHDLLSEFSWNSSSWPSKMLRNDSLKITETSHRPPQNFPLSSPLPHKHFARALIQKIYYLACFCNSLLFVSWSFRTSTHFRLESIEYFTLLVGKNSFFFISIYE